MEHPRQTLKYSRLFKCFEISNCESVLMNLIPKQQNVHTLNTLHVLQWRLGTRMGVFARVCECGLYVCVCVACTFAHVRVCERMRLCGHVCLYAFLCLSLSLSSKRFTNFRRNCPRVQHLIRIGRHTACKNLDFVAHAKPLLLELGELLGFGGTDHRFMCLLYLLYSRWSLYQRKLFVV